VRLFEKRKMTMTIKMTRDQAIATGLTRDVYDVSKDDGKTYLTSPHVNLSQLFVGWDYDTQLLEWVEGAQRNFIDNKI
jgi:hypothetical protein